MIRKGDTIENTRTGQRMHFTNTWAETKGTFLQIECFSPVTKAREPEHIHPYQENRFTIISGELRFSIDGKEKTAYAGEVVSIPKNTPHHFWNSGKTEAHYVQEFFPALRIDNLFQTFFALSRDGKLNKNGSPGLLRASLIMLAHERELRLTQPDWLIQKFIFKLLAPIAKLLGYRSQYE